MTRPLCLALALVGLLLARPAANQTPPRWFERRVSFWNSLHHELHALARPRPTWAAALAEDLAESTRAGWQQALEVYRPLGRRSLLFDEGLASMSALLSPLTDDARLPREAIAPALIAALDAAAPAYRASGWPTHQRDARAFIAAVSPLLTRHGATIAPMLAAAYGATWSVSVPVDVVRDAGPPGNAYTTVRPRAHVTIAATDPRHQGLAALELLFHEASHGWDAALTDEDHQRGPQGRTRRASGPLARGAVLHRRRADEAGPRGERHALRALRRRAGDGGGHLCGCVPGGREYMDAVARPPHLAGRGRNGARAGGGRVTARNRPLTVAAVTAAHSCGEGSEAGSKVAALNCVPQGNGQIALSLFCT